MKIIYGSLAAEKSARFNHISIAESCKRPDLIMYLPQFNFIPTSLSLRRVFQDFDLDYSIFINRFPEFTTRYKSTISSLSGGERRLAELYVIATSATKFIMLDEPFTHLNPLQIEKVKALLQQEKKKKGMLITDHMYRHILDTCDNIYVLNNGRTHLTKEIADLETLGYIRTQ
jgi:ABC-type branched-subunit amino acid transport system ATPase component